MPIISITAVRALGIQRLQKIQYIISYHQPSFNCSRCTVIYPQYIMKNYVGTVLVQPLALLRRLYRQFQSKPTITTGPHAWKKLGTAGKPVKVDGSHLDIRF